MQDFDVYEQFRDSMRRFATDKVAPHAAEVDRTGSFPAATYEAFRDEGLLGLAFEEALGGQDGDLMSLVICSEEVARYCATSSQLLMGNWIASYPLLKYGARELVETVIPPVAAGEKGMGWCLTEPQSGSDLWSLKTRAEQHGNGWVLNGRKRFITGATWADWYLVLARSGEKSFGLFLVNRDDPGLSFGRLESKMGLCGSPTADVILEDCQVPAERAVGDTAEGYRYLTDGLTYSRALISAQALGIAQGALDEAVAYTSERQQFGEPVSRFQMVRGMVADMTVKVESSRALLYQSVRAADGEDQNKARALASMAKLICSDTAMSVTTDAVQLHGGYGFLKDYPVERMMRDAKITQIYEGTNQVQRLIIAKYVYGQ
ncbi:MAG: acyl-CoA dehydrogenase family protein [Alphaproteobacteria bacterium]|jgi:hypothetical protein|nr:acyl-CoA dehydrogenase family protein [Alphaproteobacteria bacterium]